MLSYICVLYYMMLIVKFFPFFLLSLPVFYSPLLFLRWWDCWTREGCLTSPRETSLFLLSLVLWSLLRAWLPAATHHRDWSLCLDWPACLLCPAHNLTAHPATARQPTVSTTWHLTNTASMGKVRWIPLLFASVCVCLCLHQIYVVHKPEP